MRLTRSAVEWGLRALALECMSVSRVAAALGISWHTANTAILTRAEQILNEAPDRFKGVEALGVDEHVWRHTRRGDRYVTVMIDLTPVRHRSGPARLLDVVPGRSKKVLQAPPITPSNTKSPFQPSTSALPSHDPKRWSISLSH